MSGWLIKYVLLGNTDTYTLILIYHKNAVILIYHTVIPNDHPRLLPHYLPDTHAHTKTDCLILYMLLHRSIQLNLPFPVFISAASSFSQTDHSACSPTPGCFTPKVALAPSFGCSYTHINWHMECLNYSCAHTRVHTCGWEQTLVRAQDCLF